MDMEDSYHVLTFYPVAKGLVLNMEGVFHMN